MKPHPACRIRREHNSVLCHTVIHEDLHSHQSRPTRRHLRIEQKHALMALDVLGELVVVKLGLASPYAGLDQNTTGFAIRYHALQARLQGRTASKKDDS